MSSRREIIQTVSEAAPTSAALGDEWFQPSTNRLYKRAIFDGAPTWAVMIVSTPTALLDINGTNVTNVVPLTNNSVDCSRGNYFTRTATEAASWTISNVPRSRVYSFLLRLSNGGLGTQTWFTNTRWAGGTAPTLTSAGVDVLGFITDDNGSNWRGVALMLDSK
jgi:hypothetical protein